MINFFKYWFRQWAWYILEDEINKEFIHKGAFRDYVKWMCNDFPILRDTEEHYDIHGPYGGNMSNHRSDMREKYKIKLNHLGK